MEARFPDLPRELLYIMLATTNKERLSLAYLLRIYLHVLVFRAIGKRRHGPSCLTDPNYGSSIRGAG